MGCDLPVSAAVSHGQQKGREVAAGDREELEAGSLLEGAEWECPVAAWERKTGEQPSRRKRLDLKEERKDVCNRATN